MDRVIDTVRNVPGFLAVTRYEVLEHPDRLVEIAQRESPEARPIWLDQIAASGGVAC